jgi:hypothetical protein
MSFLFKKSDKVSALLAMFFLTDLWKILSDNKVFKRIDINPSTDTLILKSGLSKQVCFV